MAANNWHTTEHRSDGTCRNEILWYNTADIMCDMAGITQKKIFCKNNSSYGTGHTILLHG